MSIVISEGETSEALKHRVHCTRDRFASCANRDHLMRVMRNTCGARAAREAEAAHESERRCSGVIAIAYGDEQRVGCCVRFENAIAMHEHGLHFACDELTINGFDYAHSVGRIARCNADREVSRLKARRAKLIRSRCGNER